MIKNGFILNFAYCNNCNFHQATSDVLSSFLPKRLKEEIFDVVVKLHDAFAREDFAKHCRKRELVVSYTSCLFEENEQETTTKKAA